jgi:glycosyltransferase involved in cell wall biosynthesis
MRLPDFIDCRELYSLDRPIGYFKRRQTILRRAPALLDGVGLLNLCMPAHEAGYLYAVAKRLGISVLTEFHGDWPECALSETEGSFLRRVTRKYRARAATRLYKELGARSVAVSTIGPVLAEKYVARKTPLLVTTNHMMEEKDFRERDDFTLKTPPRILFVGELRKRKGLKYLFAALEMLVSQRQDFQFIAVGEGPEQASLQQYAVQKGFADRLRFAGVVPLGARLFEEYRNADLFVLPSIAAEGVPRVIQEAQALGCPVVATDIGSTRWQLREGAGIVVPPYDVHALKEAISHVLTDQGLRESLSRQGFHISRQYSFEKQSAGIANFVRSAIPAELLARS